KSAPVLVLFSPIAFEDHHSPNLPNGREINERLKLYTGAMAEVAAVNNIRFIDLFSASQIQYARAQTPLTINGIHLTEDGDYDLAQVIDAELITGRPGKRDRRALEPLRATVNDKNFYWFNRYRTVDGYSIYGGRADLKFVAGQTNRVVMQREMEVLDQMTANRDRLVWGAAQGRTIKTDDRNLSP